MSWKESKGLAVLGTLLAIAAIGYIVYYAMFRPVPQGDRELKCEKCQAIVKQQVTSATHYPLTCEKCKTQTVWPTQKLRCMKCLGTDGKSKEILVVDKGDGKANESKCPTCGGQLMP